MKPSGADLLEAGAKVYRERNKVYGDAFLTVGNVMAAMFPDGVELKTPDDFARFHLLEWQVGKTVRYATNFNKGGHADSILDASVYSAILAAVDERIRNAGLISNRDGSDDHPTTADASGLNPKSGGG